MVSKARKEPQIPQMFLNLFEFFSFKVTSAYDREASYRSPGL